MEAELESQLRQIMGVAPDASMIALIRHGVSLSALDRLAELGGDTSRAGIISKRTLRARRSRGKSLTKREGDQLYRVARVTLRAIHILGRQDEAYHWLRQPRPVFDGLTALDATETMPGYLAVEEELDRLALSPT